jgi:hypothetical protein
MRILALFAILALALVLVDVAQGKGKDPYKSWRFNARKAQVDPKSSVKVRTMLQYALPRQGVLVMCKWGVAMAESKAGDPSYTVKLLKPKSGRLDKKIRIPLGTRPNKSPDAALTIWDAISGREHDMWRAKYNPKTRRIVSAVNAHSFPAGADSELDKDGAIGGSNLGLVPLRRGIVTPEDLIRGYVSQTMQMALPEVGGGAPRWPAIHNLPRTAHGTTNNNVGPNRMVCGTWLRLDPSINVDTLPIQPWEKVIAKGLQNYGVIIRDFARTLIIYGKDAVNGGKKWVDAGIKPGKGGKNVCPETNDAKGAEFSTSFPWDRLQVLKPMKHKKQKIVARTPDVVKGSACFKICSKACKKAKKNKKAKKGCPKFCTKKCAKKGKN